MKSGDRQLLASAVDGSIREPDLPRLKALLGGDDAALEFYCRESLIHGALEWHYMVQQDLPAANKRRSVAVREFRERQNRRNLLVSLGVAATLILCLGLGFLHTSSRNAAKLSLRFNAVAEYSISRDARIIPADDGELLRGDRLVLKKGAVEINLESGVRGIVEAPADMTLIAPNRIRMAFGTAFFEITKTSARGFQVDLLGSEIVDLGTRFGVLALQDKAAEIHVLEGRVQARRVNDSRKNWKPHPVLPAGMAVREDDLAAKGYSLIPLDPARFAAALPHGTGRLRLDFDEMEKDGTFHAEGLSPDGGVRLVAENGGTISSVPGIVGNALAFDGSGSRLVLEGWDAIHSDQPRTVSFWLRLPLISDQAKAPGMAIVSWGGTETTTERSFEIIMTPPTFSKPGYLRIATGEGQGFISPTYLFDGKWHHVAAVFDPTSGAVLRNRFSLYLDGAKESVEYSSITAVNTRRTRNLTIGNHSSSSISTPFQGSIDQLRIDPVALSPDEISDLARSSPHDTTSDSPEKTQNQPR